MRRPSGLWLSILAAFVNLAPLAARPAAAIPPAAYSAAEIRGWVVDVETKQPIEGVHVVAQWILNTGVLEGRHTKALHIMETVTDATGQYYFPGWGPKLRPPFSRLDDSDPLITFFKPGYRPLNRSNMNPDESQDNAVRVSRWHGKTIALAAFHGTPTEWVRLLRLLQIQLGWGEPTDEFPHRANDYWRYFPRTVLTILKERDRLPEDLPSRLRRLETWDTTEGQLRAAAAKKETME